MLKRSLNTQSYYFKYLYSSSLYINIKYSTYNSKDIEEKWKNKWKIDNYIQHPSDHQLKYNNNNNNNNKKSLFYVLSMFPYPSGKLHMGHVRVYTISDVIARYSKMKGNKVINPIGWDSFGLPAENAARQNNTSASLWTKNNINDMKKQLQPLGINFQWDRELETSSPEYYKWTQWIFLQLFYNNLAYQKKSYVNWDPIDKTVLANEQVLSDGTSWRSGAKVEQRSMNQWYFRISSYASRLLTDLKDLKNTWPSTVLTLQQNWIGKPSNGCIITFKLSHKDFIKPLSIDIFTTRPDTIYGTSFIGLSPYHQILQDIQSLLQSCSWKYQLHELLNKSMINRHHGDNIDNDNIDIISLHDIIAIHPLTKKSIPVYICSYVLDDYGSGAIMGVPAHDERDYKVAQQMNLPIIDVIQVNELNNTKYLQNSDQFSGLEQNKATKQIINKLKENNNGNEHTMYRIRDWLVSRQRYWGAPIPIIHCKSCGIVPVKESDLPITLPNVENLGSKSLADIPEWYNTICPLCNNNAKRETDTMDTFVDSSWYYARYLDSNNSKEFINDKKAKDNLPVDIYIGGNEHAILHLLYARFIHKFLYDIKKVYCNEPFKALLTQGMVHGKTYRLLETGKYLQPNEYKLENDKPIYIQDPSQEIQISYEKMSKSKFNGLQPQDLIDNFGADTVRLYILFKAPPSKVLEWDHKGIIGQHRWLVRIWNLVQNFINYHQKSQNQSIKQTNDLEKHDKILEKELDTSIKTITNAISLNYNFNVAIASLMKLSNVLNKHLDIEDGYSTPYFIVSLQHLLIMLSPMAPFISEELWYQLSQNNIQGINGSIHDQPWPQKQKEEQKQKQNKIIIQLQGKTKDIIPLPNNIEINKESIEEYIKQHPKFKQTLLKRDISKVIYLSKANVINFIFK